jgi:DNA-binding transcriptional MerR regulator
MSASVSIQTVSERTGLSTYVIRAWERRYRILEPARTVGGHRSYSEPDIQRLLLLARVARSGRSIGSIAQLSNEALQKLLGPGASFQTNAPRKRTLANPAPRFIRELLQAVRRLDSRELDRSLEDARAALGWQSLLELVIAPTAAQLGELWRAGKVSPMEEHFFVAAVKGHLCSRCSQFPRLRNAPRMVLGTPAGQLHELGAILAGAAAAHLGWETAYLGPSLPSEELLRAVRVFNANVLTLSIIHPPDDPALQQDLHQLVQLLPPEVRLIVGGTAAPHYASAFQGRAIQVDTIASLCSTLDQLRPGTPQPHSQPHSPLPLSPNAIDVSETSVPTHSSHPNSHPNSHPHPLRSSHASAR